MSKLIIWGIGSKMGRRSKTKRLLARISLESEEKNKKTKGVSDGGNDKNKSYCATHSSMNFKKQAVKHRKTSSLLTLYEKGKIEQDQYASGERLLRDYELSFRNKSFSNLSDEVRVQKSEHYNVEFFVIQNLDAWNRYNKAINSIENHTTRDIIRKFCIEGIGITQLDKQLGKRGVAEVRLWYGLRELVGFYRVKNTKGKDN